MRKKKINYDNTLFKSINSTIAFLTIRIFILVTHKRINIFNISITIHKFLLYLNIINIDNF